MHTSLELRASFVMSSCEDGFPAPAYLETPETVGEHLLKRRLDRGLRQKDAASEIGCDPATGLKLASPTGQTAEVGLSLVQARRLAATPVSASALAD